VIPSRILVLLMLIPLGFAVAVVADRSMLWPMFAADGFIALVALADLLLARRPLVDVRRTSREVFSIGRQNPVTLELRSRAARRLHVEVTDDLFDHAAAPELPMTVDLRPGARAQATYRVVPRRRGTYALGAHTLRYRSPLGLWIRQLRVPASQPVRIYPDVQAVRDYELLARQSDDEYRRIDWKATARRHKLITRQYQLERDQSIVFMLDAGRLMSAESDDLSLFDHALNATLMLTYVASRGGDQVGMMTFADRVLTYLPPGPGKSASQRLIRSLFSIHPELVETDYEGAFTQLGPRLRKRSLVVLFTQIQNHNAAQQLLRLARGLQPRHLPLIILLRDPAVESLVHIDAADCTTASLRPYVSAAAAETLSWQARLIRDLKRAGALVLDVFPRELSPSLVNRYLEIKARQML
jgi:uncharacterized protein (DUF58 family)